MKDSAQQDMAPIQHSLQLEDDIALHNRGWIAQKIGWAFFSLILLLALLGGFGSGPLSHTSFTSQDGEVKYERFLRFESEAEIAFHLRNIKDTALLAIPYDYLSYVDVTNINPAPIFARATSVGVQYFFVADGDATIQLTIMARKIGSIKKTIATSGGDLQIKHLIYP